MKLFDRLICAFSDCILVGDLYNIVYCVYRSTGNIPRCNIAFPFTNYWILLVGSMSMLDMLIWAFLWLYVGVEFIQCCKICILTHRRHAGMQYYHSVCKFPDGIRKIYKAVRQGDVCFTVTVYWQEIYIILSSVHIDPPETFQDAILLFHLQITRQHREDIYSCQIG